MMFCQDILKGLQQFFTNLLISFQDALHTNPNAIKFRIKGDGMEDEISIA
jgi:hypothetical protein